MVVFSQRFMRIKINDPFCVQRQNFLSFTYFSFYLHLHFVQTTIIEQQRNNDNDNVWIVNETLMLMMANSMHT